jgi:hypothetical protein
VPRPEVDSTGVDGESDQTTGDDTESSAELTTILRSDEIEPGTVVISDEYLDEAPEEPVASEPLSVALASTAPPAKPDYNPDSNFGAVLDTSADITGRIKAFRNLGQAWDVELPEVLIRPACEELAAQGVRCLTIGSWAQLLRFNRPSIVVLEQRDQLHRVIVFEVDGAQAKVLVGDNIHTVSQQELQARWARNAITFWRPSEAGNAFLQRGDQSLALPLVRKTVNQALANADLPLLLNLESDNFDLELAHKAFALQTRIGIVADSKIGNETYLLMNELISPEQTPVLQQRRP